MLLCNFWLQTSDDSGFMFLNFVPNTISSVNLWLFIGLYSLLHFWSFYRKNDKKVHVSFSRELSHQKNNKTIFFRISVFYNFKVWKFLLIWSRNERKTIDIPVTEYFRPGKMSKLVKFNAIPAITNSLSLPTFRRLNQYIYPSGMPLDKRQWMVESTGGMKK